ncbi:MAG: glycine cleavage T C-terminal barrel domain-containing protein, partial [Pyrinomonadaceae bacterium]
SIQGAGASGIASRVLGNGIRELERGRIHPVQFEDKEVTAIRATHTAEDGFDLLIAGEHVTLIWNALVESGARPIGEDAINILRIEAGLPRYSVDIGETYNVLEAGLDAGISYTKGCYIGQEIIARIHWRGHVAKRLAGLSMTDRVEIAPDARVKSTEGKEIGRITSSIYSPVLKQTIALGIIKYDFLAPGTRVTVVSENNELPSVVTELPFVKGSWQQTHAAQPVTI